MHKRDAFTLLEVMIAVVIISVVIMALLQMFANNNYIFSSIDKKTDINQYTSFFVSNPKYGFEKESVYLDELVVMFNVEDELRRELKTIKAEILYQELDEIDMSDFDITDEEESDSYVDSYENQDSKNVSSNMVFEIGKTILLVNEKNSENKLSSSLLRIRVKDAE